MVTSILILLTATLSSHSNSRELRSSLKLDKKKSNKEKQTATETFHSHVKSYSEELIFILQEATLSMQLKLHC